MKEYRDKVYEYIKSMMEVSFEYVDFNEEEVDGIYILCSTEEGLVFEVFYSINGNIAMRHEVNNFLKKKCIDSSEQQMAVIDIGLEDLKGIVKLFRNNKDEVPKSIKIVYLTTLKNFDADFNYTNQLIDTNLTHEDLKEKWIEDLKNNNDRG